MNDTLNPGEVMPRPGESFREYGRRVSNIRIGEMTGLSDAVAAYEAAVAAGQTSPPEYGHARTLYIAGQAATKANEALAAIKDGEGRLTPAELETLETNARHFSAVAARHSAEIQRHNLDEANRQQAEQRQAWVAVERVEQEAREAAFFEDRNRSHGVRDWRE